MQGQALGHSSPPSLDLHRVLRQLPPPCKSRWDGGRFCGPVVTFLFNLGSRTQQNKADRHPQNSLFLSLFKLVQLFAEASCLEALAVCCWCPDGDDVIVLI